MQTLKGQFQEHKARWMNERELLVRAVQSSEAHREVAQGFAEKAVTQMESMIEAAENEVCALSAVFPSISCELRPLPLPAGAGGHLGRALGPPVGHAGTN